MNDYFQLTSDNGIAHLQLNRPERMNTMAPPFFPAFREAVQVRRDMRITRDVLAQPMNDDDAAACGAGRRPVPEVELDAVGAVQGAFHGRQCRHAFAVVRWVTDTRTRRSSLRATHRRHA